MPSTSGTVESLVTSFSDAEPYGELPTHGAFLKIESSVEGRLTISGKASANAAQPLVFVICEKNTPSHILSATVTLWNHI